MYEYKLTPYGDEIDIEDAVWCCWCGDQLFYGNPYYIYEDKIYCQYCAGSNDIIYDAIEVCIGD
jgi:hypothetical protein